MTIVALPNRFFIWSKRSLDKLRREHNRAAQEGHFQFHFRLSATIMRQHFKQVTTQHDFQGIEECFKWQKSVRAQNFQIKSSYCLKSEAISSSSTLTPRF